MSIQAEPLETRPHGLMCELLGAPQTAYVTDLRPDFAWIVPSAPTPGMQTARRLQVASRRDDLADGRADLWDTGRVARSESVGVTYAGKPLEPGRTYFWRVRTWNEAGQESPWSEIQEFRTAPAGADREKPDVADRLDRHALARVPGAPTRTVEIAPGHLFLDFGRATFGYLELTGCRVSEPSDIEIRLGEKATGDTVDLKPGATVRAGTATVRLEPGKTEYVVPAPEFKRPAEGVDLPPFLPSVMPFRYVEAVGGPEGLGGGSVRRVTVQYPFDREAATFRSSDPTLDAIWALCRDSIEATTFAGIYVDGDRERIPYEADAFLNQLCHYGVDREFALARYSHEYLLTHPTWPTEWKHHSIFIAWYDYLYTGNADLLARDYEILQKKLLLERLRPDGLLGSGEADVKRGDIVDWPLGERDGYVMTPVNTVVNAFHYRALVLMEKIAATLGKTEDAARYRDMHAKVRAGFDSAFFDEARGVYRDGVGTEHASQHANFFPLAFGLVSDTHRPRVLAFIESRGMAPSVYAAQYLLDALFENGRDDLALHLITDPNTDRSWAHMVKSGTTITWEAWDTRYKPNQDWNHAWGAAPANLIPRHVLGVTPLEPGFSHALIAPRIGALTFVSGRVPTIRGTVEVDLRRDGGRLTARVTIPSNMTAGVELPATGLARPQVTLDGRARTAIVESGRIVFDRMPPGTHEFVIADREAAE